MPRILYITTELPYFPGQGGLMSLHMRQLAQEEIVGVLGPRYPHQPEDSLQKLRDTVQRSYWWPEHPVPGPYPALSAKPPRWPVMIKRLPNGIKRWLIRRLTGMYRYSDDAVAWRQVLVNLAPKILEALDQEYWNVVLLSQSTSAGWLPFLPASLARCIVLHDIRSDYLQRSANRLSSRNLEGVRLEESIVVQETDAIVVLSALDHERANTQLQPVAPIAIAPICLDLDYFEFQPSSNAGSPVVLFTGHLSHPPNVDAVLYFLDSIWPRILAAQPEATFKIVGLHPSPVIAETVTRALRVELIPNVPDIRPYYQSSRVYVVPMRYGGGVRQKILEAWAVGRPVVTTTMGAEGIAAHDGENCWIRDEPASIAAQVVELLREPCPATVLRTARSLVEAQHSPQVACPPLATQLKVAASRRRQSPPRVLYDLRWLVPGKVGGVEQMTRELVDEIASFDRTFEYRFQGHQRVFRDWRFPSGFKHKVVCSDGPAARRMAWRDGLVNQLTAELAWPPLMSPELRALEWYTRLDFTVVHGLPCLVHPDLRRFPSVVTMHDLQHLHRPEFFSPADITTREREYRESCHRASHVICTSEFTRQDVHRRYGIPLDKMTTIWNLPPRQTGTNLGPTTLRRLLQGMGIKPPFFFYPAAPWLHKNHRGLLDAMLLSDRALPADYKLVMTGQPFSADHPATSLLLDPRLRNRVVHLGYRSTLEITALYRAAEALIFPSLFEGFGMPIIEAMQQGCPVVCGQHTCLSEIAGDAVLYTDVASPDAISAAILRIIGDDPLKAKLRQSGSVNLRRFDRRSLAEKTRAIYASVHAEHFD